MAWFALGALLLLLAVPGGGGKPKRVDATGLAAIALFAAAAWRGLYVYPAAKLAPIVLAWAAALALVLLLRPRRSPPPPARWMLVGLGGASSLFALFGPPDGLF